MPSAPKSVLNWEVSKLKSVLEKSKTLKKMFVTLLSVLILNKSAKPLCSANKSIHSRFPNSVAMSVLVTDVVFMLVTTESF